MQQTETYKLNLVEKEDVFSPEALNENMEKLDDTLLAAHMGAVAEHDQRTGETAALDQRVTALEVHKIAVGTYLGNNGEQTIELPFTPAAVLVFPKQYHQLGCCAMAISDSFAFYNSFAEPHLSIVPNGFTVHYVTASQPYLNENSQTYHYLALA